MSDLNLSKVELLNTLKEQLERQKKKLEILTNRTKENIDSANISSSSNNLINEIQQTNKVEPEKNKFENNPLKRKLNTNISAHNSDDVNIITANLINLKDDRDKTNTIQTTSFKRVTSISRNESYLKIQNLSITSPTKTVDNTQTTAINFMTEGLEKLKSHKHEILDFDLPEDEFAELKQKKINEFNAPVEHFPDFMTKTSGKIIDFDWMAMDESGVGCLLSACENGFQIYKKTGGNWVKTIDWMAENKKLLKANILKVSHSLDVDHVVVAVLLEEAQIYNYELSLLKFSGDALISDNLLHGFSSTVQPPILRTVLPDHICISSPSSSSPPLFEPSISGNKLLPPEFTTSLLVFQVCIDSASLLSSKQLDGVPEFIRDLIPIMGSSTLCGLSDDGAYLWHYKAGILLKKVSFGEECQGFIPCCDVMYQDKGLLALAGRTANDDQGRIIFINPLSGICLSTTLKDMIPSSNTDELRLLRCGGPLQKAVFVSGYESGKLEVFTTVGKKVTTSSAPLPKGWSDKVLGGEDLVVRFDSKLKLMFLGIADEFCCSNIEINVN